jgi:hypothetical protein
MARSSGFIAASCRASAAFCFCGRKTTEGVRRAALPPHTMQREEKMRYEVGLGEALLHGKAELRQQRGVVLACPQLQDFQHPPRLPPRQPQFVLQGEGEKPRI